MSQPPKSDKTSLVLLRSASFEVKFPDPPTLLRDKHADSTRHAVLEHAAITPDGKVFYERDALPALLATDSAGSARVVAELRKDEFFRDGEKLYIEQPALNKVYSKRLQEPRDSYERLRLQYGESCVNAVRDAPELQNTRGILHARINLELPGAKKEVLRNATSCISGAPLDKSPDVHHIERVADKPDLALEANNMVPANRPIHKQIHAERAHTPEQLDALAEREGWPWRSPAHGKDGDA